MIRLIITLALASAFGITAPSGERKLIRNPVVWADVPDPSVIRVGGTYYMSSTTMHMSPGLPIMKSKDLIDWRPVGYAYDTLGDNDALSLKNGKNAYGRGSWASSLRYHNGTFYVTTFSSTTGMTHIFSTRDIEHGTWKAAAFRPALHDHSLFFDDDGRVYMVHGSGNIRLTELNSDVSAIKPGGADQVIIPNASLAAGPNVGLQAEGSQIYKINGRYYVFMITWPRGGMRTQLVFRSDKLTGPYEGRIALQDQGIAQGGLIDTPKGDWYAFLFQDHGAVGRTPCLVPVKWEEGWPILGTIGKAPASLAVRARQPEVPAMVASDEFSHRSLPLVWQWNHNPVKDLWSVSERPGFLRLRTGRMDNDLITARNTLTQRTFGPACSGAVALDVSGMKEGDCAGLGLLQRKYGFAGVRIEGGTPSIVMESVESGAANLKQSIALTKKVVFLRADCNFDNRKDEARFYFSLDGKDWQPVGKPLAMAYTLPHFMGYRFALFNYATKTPGGYADFDYFRISNVLTAQGLR